MKNKIILVLLLFVVIGCAPYKEFVAKSNRGNLSHLMLGTNQEHVLDVMGKPWKTESYFENNSTFVILYYVTQVVPDGATTEDEMTPLVLKENKLIGWGRKFFSDLRIQILSNQRE